ncbi:MAG TPA: glutathione S-transferase C-terminal domain-containing protein [Solirubrobacteraceae bacterium]|nr:glutathione S-transferase C-terminal domain-containing protein [Solirubrobacteraceae bacterium]
MGTSAGAFSLGAERGDDGSFRRQDSTFRAFVSDDGSTEFPVAAGRYHLYVARACPWAHRTLIGRALMGLEEAISVSYVDPIRDERGWRFTDRGYVDSANGFRYLSEAYRASDPDYDARATVPVLWDRERATIVNNESGDVLRMLSTVFSPLASHPVELVPERLRSEIDALNRLIYDNVNNGVYKAGFATRQDAYERAVMTLFQTLDELDLRLADSRFLFGPEPLETDWRLFTTLVRFDAVYQIHFKCSIRKLVEYEYLWPYARDLYQWPGVAATVDFDEIRAHYYRTHPMINPSELVAMLPAASFEEPADRK